MGDVIILNLSKKKHNHMMYAYSDMGCSHRYNVLSFQAIFCSFAQLLTPKTRIWKKCKKTPGDIWEMWRKTDVIIYFSFRQFLVLLPPYSPKPENVKKKWNKLLEISSFNTSVPKIMILCYITSEMAHDRCNCHFIFSAFFALLPS